MMKKAIIINGVVWLKDKSYGVGEVLSSPPLSNEEWEEVNRLLEKYPNFIKKIEDKNELLHDRGSQEISTSKSKRSNK